MFKRVNNRLEQIEGQIGRQVGGQVWERVRNQVWNKVRVLKELTYSRKIKIYER